MAIDHQERLEEYCRPFIGATSPWPCLPLPQPPSINWWKQWLNSNKEETRFERLRIVLPQLWITPHQGASKSEAYKRLVLGGKEVNQQDKDNKLKLNDPSGFKIKLAEHPCGACLVFEINNHADFINIVQCLAHRCEQANIQPSVHAQAVAGLIHWGLIRSISRNQRAELIILHRSPYSSLPASQIQESPTEQEWVEISQQWRLEHELTHIATQRLAGEMRLNLFDELIADALGMIKSLKYFSADLFCKGLGINADGSIIKEGRVHTYTSKLNSIDKSKACELVIKRAHELEKLLSKGTIKSERIDVLRYLTQQTLDQPLSEARNSSS